MRFVVGWGRDEELPDRQPRVQVKNVEELDALLDRLDHERGEDGLPYAVEIADEDSGDGFVTYHLQLTVGHSECAGLLFVGEPEGGVGYEPGLQRWRGGTVLFDCGGEPTEYEPDALRVTPAAAREAAREWVGTGRRPTCVQWER